MPFLSFYMPRKPHYFILCIMHCFLYLHVSSVQLASSLVSTGFLLGLQFDPEDGGDMFLRNVGLSSNYNYNPQGHIFHTTAGRTSSST
jgi:hypothetical protein